MPPRCGTRWQRQPKTFPATKKTRRVHSAPSRKLFDPPSPEDHAEREALCFVAFFPPPSPLSLGISPPPPGSCSLGEKEGGGPFFAKFHLSCRGGKSKQKRTWKKRPGRLLFTIPAVSSLRKVARKLRRKRQVPEFPTFERRGEGEERRQREKGRGGEMALD